ncbi:meiosis inhibitor protein 1-like isoform X1 [Argiope bruennichi]|uniref:meiosis inhibitor protein 1-like isoform X1 n=1 Tax=Argiope bruennichi TaxID=94029 RepID=UPI002493D448|nr:meiosis inhibitor protein 1-like isoform X1 [Argiope bruennichi]
MYPSEDVRSTVAYIFLQIYSPNSISPARIFSSADSIVGKGILSVLKCGSTKHLIKIGLALLKAFISHSTERILLLFGNSNEDVNFITVIKKIIVSSEPIFQVCVIQCLCHILSNSSSAEIHIKMLMEENIPELLFEVINGNNELLIETAICCLRIFTHCSLFLENCHILYGINTLLDVGATLLKLKNWRLLCLVFDLLSTLNCEQFPAIVSSQSSIIGQALKLMENSFKIHNLQVLSAVSEFFCALLKKEQLPYSILSQLFVVVQISMKNFQKFLSSQSGISAEMKNYQENKIENLPLEVKLLIRGLDILFCFLRVLRRQSQGCFRSEEIFSYPSNETSDESLNTCKKDFQAAVHGCISALDKIFIPYCLLLDVNSSLKKISYFHLVQVLSEIFEEPFDSTVLMLFAKKLVKAKMFSYIWNIKIDKFLLSKMSFEESSAKCNQCLASLLKFTLQKHKDLDAHMETIKNGLAELNHSFDECFSVLSQKDESEGLMTTSSNLYSMQITILCLCYVTYLNDAPIVKAKTLIPHLVYYITCNLESILASTFTVKYLIFILAMCMHENTKFQTGLTEVSALIWDALSKMNCIIEIYTHHEILLWWTFGNPQFSSFSSFVLQVWMKFSLCNSNFTILNKIFTTLLNLLCTNDVAQETFIRQFDSNSEISFYFLRNAFDSEIYENENTNIKETFVALIQTLVQYIQNCTLRILVMKNHINEKVDDGFLLFGMECMLWCYRKIPTLNSQLDMKLVFHVTNFCSNSSFEDHKILIQCLKFLQFASKIKDEHSKAWFLITGNTNFFPFLKKCLTVDKFTADSLHLISNLVAQQINGSLKNTTWLKIPFAQILKWLKCSKTKCICFEILNRLLENEFTNTFIQINSAEQNTCLSGKSLSRKDLRLLVICVQNAMALDDPVVEEIVFSTYINLLSYISKTDPTLEKHLMLQPWLKILLEIRLDDVNTNLELFEKWISYKYENITLIKVVQQFAVEILNIQHNLNQVEHYVMKLFSSVYQKYIPKNIKMELKKIVDTKAKSNDFNRKFQNCIVSEVEAIVTNYIENISNNDSVKETPLI